MILLQFNIRHPFKHNFKNLWCRAWPTWFKNKFIELEFYTSSDLVSFRFNWTVRTDHAGLDIEAGLFGYNVHFNFYDNRHWNSEEGRWMFYTEEEGLH
jgi:hypothetical protein